MRKILNYIFFTLALLLSVSCSRSDEYLLLQVSDIAHQRVAIEHGALGLEDQATRFPDAESKSFSSVSEMLLSLSIGKFDAAVVTEASAAKVLSHTEDFALLDKEEFAGDSVKVIVHKSRIPGRNMENAHSGGFVDESLSRIKKNFMSENYWKLILNGLLITVILFNCAWLLAMFIAISMTLLSYVESMKFITKPLMFIIKTLHDVPSVVLIFFFYYIVFAQTDTEGLLACIVALGVYGSGSFTNIIRTHLDDVDPMQHKVAHVLGLKGWKKYRLVILPQAVKSMLPFLLSDSKVLLRATTYAGYVSLLDIVKVSELIRNHTYDTLVPLVFVSIVFLILSWLIREGLYQLYYKLFTNDRN